MALIIILFSIMTASAYSASLDGEMCWAGESFWCQSLANAEACRAVDHCRKTVWKNQELEEKWSLSNASSTEKCRVCQTFFSSLQTRLKNAENQALILNALRVEICTLLSSAVNTDTCMRAAGSTLPLILEMSLQNNDYKTLCQHLTMCESEEDDPDQLDINSSIPHASLFLIEDGRPKDNNTKCYVCRQVIDFLKNQQNLSVVIENTIVTYVCHYISPFGKLCEGFVKLLVSRIVDDLKIWLKNLNPCEHLRLCVNDSKNHAFSSSVSVHQDQQHLPSARKPTVCQLCLQVFKTANGSEAANYKTETTLLSAMRLVCDSLWWPHGNHCHKMVDAVGRPVLEKLSQRLHTEGACQMLGFCDGASVVDIISESINTVASDRCSYCQSTAEYLTVLLSQGRAVNVIQSNVKRVCGFRPFGMDDEECEFVVNKYTPVLVDYLVDDLSRDNVCQMEQFCGR